MIFERVAIGDRFLFGSHRFLVDDIKRFASAYDPQDFHLDDAKARKSLFGAVCASGWHTASVMSAKMAHYFQREVEQAAARGEPVAPLGPSPGFDNLRWTKPVYPDDTITFAGLVVDKKEAETSPRWGIVSFDLTGTNQRDETVFAVRSHVYVRRVPA